MVTAQGAVLALALRFLRTGDPLISAALAPPATPSALASVRGDVLLHNVVARTLVDWHEHDWCDAERAGEPAEGPPPSRRDAARADGARRAWLRAWLTAQVPAFVRRVMRRLYAHGVATGGPGAAAAQLAALMALLEEEEAAGASGGGAPAAPAAPAPAAPVPAPAFAPAPRDLRDGPIEDIDVDAMKEAYALSLAGGAAALGLRYAGTCDLAVRDEILGVLHLLLVLREASSSARGARPTPSAGQLARNLAAAAAAAAAGAASAARSVAAIAAEGGSAHARAEAEALVYPLWAREPAADDLLPAGAPEPARLPPGSGAKARPFTPTLALALAPPCRSTLEMALASAAGGWGW